jgi:hypothetical protein
MPPTLSLARLRYEELMRELLAERDKRGPLSQTEESRYVGQLDRCWDQMTEEERKQVEEMFSPSRRS